MKRNLFNELKEGFDALEQEREGKITLRTYRVEKKPAPEMSRSEVIRIRESMNLSRPVFADHLRISTRTLENWEQGRSHVPTHTALLLRMMERFPDTMERLDACS